MNGYGEVIKVSYGHWQNSKKPGALKYINIMSSIPKKYSNHPQYDDLVNPQYGELLGSGFTKQI